MVMEWLYLLLPLQILILGFLFKQQQQIGKLCGYITRRKTPDNYAAEPHDLEDK
jgi:hypothetical protein